MMRSSLGRARERAFARLAGWLDRAEQRPLAEGVRLALASLPEGSSPAEILSTFPVAVAALLRRRQGDAPLAPEPARATADELNVSQGGRLHAFGGRSLHDSPLEGRVTCELVSEFPNSLLTGKEQGIFTFRPCERANGCQIREQIQ